MQDIASWDWETGEKAVADIGEIRSRYEEVRELAVSDDGEKIAATVKGDEGITPCVNGELWNVTFDKAWCLRFLPTGNLFALVMKDDEWTVGVEGKTWEEKFDFAWNPRFTDDGTGIMVQIKSGMDYSLAVNGKAWEKTFRSIREFAISPNGQTVIAAAQVEPLKEGDTEKFFAGVWGVAVNDELLEGWLFRNELDREDRKVETAGDPAKPDELQVEIKGGSERAIFGVIGIAAAPLVSEVSVGSRIVVVGAVGWVGCMDGAERQRRSQALRASDPAPDVQQRHPLAVEREVCDILEPQRTARDQLPRPKEREGFFSQSSLGGEIDHASA